MSDFTLEHVSSYEPVVAGATAFPHLISTVVWVNEFELESISAIDIRYGELLNDGMVAGQYESNELWVSSLKHPDIVPIIGPSAVIQPVAEMIMQPYIVDLYYNPPDVIFAGHIKGFSGRSTNVPQISYMRMLPEAPLYNNQNEVFGEDEYTYVGMFGNSQMITQTVSGSIRPGSGFVYPRKI